MRKNEQPIKRVGIVFSGGPAPAANAVISAAACSFLADNCEVIGFFHGFASLQEYHPISHRLLPNRDYRVLTEEIMRGLRTARGVCIGTSRANPGKGISCPEDLNDPKKLEGLRNVYTALVDLEIDALVSIGGDGTLRTANLLYEYQNRLPEGARRVRVVHVPKTIDNDYRGIDFTFGFFTAVDVIAREVSNLRADGIATSSYFICETMGRRASWLAYGVAIGGEANLVVGVEDIDESLSLYEEVSDGKGGTKSQRRLDVDKLVAKIVDLMIVREEKRNRHSGVIILAEGLSELLPSKYAESDVLDQYGHLPLASRELSKIVAKLASDLYFDRTNRRKKITGLQLGYEARSAPPHAFDVILGSQLGVGAYRALSEANVDGHMISVKGQLDLRYVPFGELINPQTLAADVRYVDSKSDFHQLARFLERRADREWTPAHRAEEGDL